MARRRELEHYYHTLGLRVGANEKAVRDAYKQLAKKYHPDRNPGNQEAMEKFLKLKEAYEAIIERKTTSKVATKVEERALELKRDETFQRRSRRAGFAVASLAALVVIALVGIVVRAFVIGGGPIVQAAELQRAGRYEEAVARLDEIPETAKPELRSQALLFKAAVQGRAGDYVDGVETLRAYAAEMGDDPAAFALLGDLQVLLGNADAGVQAYEHAIELSPDDRDLQAQYAGALLRAGRVEAAQSRLETLANTPDAVGVWAQTLLYLRAGDYERAAGLPDDAETFVARANRGLVYMLNDQLAEAKAELEAARFLAEGQDTAGRGYGVFYRRPMIDPRHPFDVLPRLRAEVQRSAVLVIAGDHKLRERAYTEAIETFQEAEIVDRDWAVLQFAIGSAYTTMAAKGNARERFMKAAFRFEQSASLDDSLLAAKTHLAVARLGEGRSKDALELMDVLVSHSPRDPQLHIQRGRLYGKTGDTRTEMSSYRAALRVDPNLGEAHMAMGELYLATDKYAQALAEFRRATKDPRVADNAWLAIAEEAYARNDCKRAVPAYKQLLRSETPDSRHFFQLACCQTQQGQLESAFDSLVRASRTGLEELSIVDADPCFERLRRGKSRPLSLRIQDARI